MLCEFLAPGTIGRPNRLVRAGQNNVLKVIVCSTIIMPGRWLSRGLHNSFKAVWPAHTRSQQPCGTPLVTSDGESISWDDDDDDTAILWRMLDNNKPRTGCDMNCIPNGLPSHMLKALAIECQDRTWIYGVPVRLILTATRSCYPFSSSEGG
jgi:hypothetical protein